MGIGVMETTSPAYALQRKQEIINAMRIKKQEKNLAHIFFCVVDILQEENTCFVVDDQDAELLTDAFSVVVDDGQASLGNILSRKKQLVPMLEKFFSAS